MSPSQKKILIFALAVGFRDMIIKQLNQTPTHLMSEQEIKDRDMTAWRAIKLAEAGQAAIDKNGYIKVDNSMVRRAKRKINQLYKDGEEFEIVEALSFLLLGLQELQTHCNDTTYIDPIEKRAMWFTKLFDPRLENEDVHANALRRYEAWLKN